MTVHYLLPKGTRIRCLRDNYPGRYFTAGKEYVVGGRYYGVFPDTIAVIADDGHDDGWDCRFFELAEGPW